MYDAKWDEAAAAREALRHVPAMYPAVAVLTLALLALLSCCCCCPSCVVRPLHAVVLALGRVLVRVLTFGRLCRTLNRQRSMLAVRPRPCAFVFQSPDDESRPCAALERYAGSLLCVRHERLVIAGRDRVYTLNMRAFDDILTRFEMQQSLLLLWSMRDMYDRDGGTVFVAGDGVDDWFRIGHGVAPDATVKTCDVPEGHSARFAAALVHTVLRNQRHFRFNSVGNRLETDWFRVPRKTAIVMVQACVHSVRHGVVPSIEWSK